METFRSKSVCMSIIIIIFIQDFGTLLHKIKHETIKIKHNTSDSYHIIKSHWIKLN